MSDINVKKVDSMPDHINTFLESNKDSIIKIYNDEKKANEDKYGIILIQMDLEKNKVDITYIIKETNDVAKVLLDEMWSDYETNKKQIIFIMDTTHGNFVIDLNDTV
tara:strand:- start:1799 stop:2119 length:321 start_codon:yes stop_codon:yes gene_type:complete